MAQHSDDGDGGFVAGNTLNDVLCANTNFQAAASPAVINVKRGLGRNGHRGFIAVDPSLGLLLGDLYVSFSCDGVNFGNTHLILNGESFPLDDMDIAVIRVIHAGTDCGYRVVVW